MNNKRIHELLEQLNNSLNHPDAKKEYGIRLKVGVGPNGDNCIDFRGLGLILQHLLEVDIQDHSGREFCNKHNKDVGYIFVDNDEDPYWNYMCEECYKEKSQEDKENS